MSVAENKICRICSNVMLDYQQTIWDTGLNIRNYGINIPPDLAINEVSYRCHYKCINTLKKQPTYETKLITDKVYDTAIAVAYLNYSLPVMFAEKTCDFIKSCDNKALGVIEEVPICTYHAYKKYGDFILTPMQLVARE